MELLTPTPAPQTHDPNDTIQLSKLPPLDLQQATKRSREVWQKDLEQLFYHAKDRFPDVVWETVDDDTQEVVDQVWGHKGRFYLYAWKTNSRLTNWICR